MSLPIIDDKQTRIELAEMGVESRPRVKLCRDCRFEISHHGIPSCLIDGKDACNSVNPRGECERFEAGRWQILWALVPMGIGVFIGYLVNTP